jgi:tRNA U34 5-carboxymethylaminomethyl modifying GTPase MnmE/TrmE
MVTVVKNGLVLGKTNAGKTLFIINFAAFLGLRRLSAEITGVDGYTRRVTVTPEQARKEWVSPEPHKTRRLCRVKLLLPKGKGKKMLILTDSTGLVEGIPRDPELRRSIGQTLLSLRQADFIIHIIDASQAMTDSPLLSPGEVDYQLAQYGQFRRNYILLANKMDLPAASAGLELLRKNFEGTAILPVSALEKKGFVEVREHLQRYF